MPGDPVTLVQPATERAKNGDERRQLDETLEQRTRAHMYLRDEQVGPAPLGDNLLNPT
jgi:hypothetical protein